MMLSTTNLTIGSRLTDISLTLEPGTVTAICGPNGAGKTTLLTALAGLQDDGQDNVTLSGNPLSTLHPQERAKLIGYLPQDAEIAWDVSVGSLVKLGRLPHRDRGEEAVARAIEALDLDAFVDRPVSTLSGGEKARALLARVLAGEPQWILADEPLAALDLAHQFTLIAHLRRQADAGVGVAMVMHDLAMARNYADRVIMLDRGRCVADGRPEEALSLQRIAEVFSVNGEWVGPIGKMAFSCYPTGATG